MFATAAGLAAPSKSIITLLNSKRHLEAEIADGAEANKTQPISEDGKETQEDQQKQNGCPQFEPMPNNKPRGGMPPNDGRPQQVTDGNCTQPIYNKKKHPKDNKKNEKNVVNKDGENETDDDDEDTQAKTNSSLNYSESASIMIQRIMMVAIVIFMFSAICVYMVKKSISKSQPVRPQRVYGVIRSSSSEFSF